MQELGKFLLLVGIATVVLGLLLYFSPQLPFLKRLGSLPGDIRIEKEGFRLYFPLGTSLLLSLLLSLFFYLWRR